MRYIASCSFGKDSLAAIITRIEHSEPIDKVLYCKIMFDDNISAELPEHEAWIHEHAIPLLKSRYGLDTDIVQSDKNYVGQFYTKYRKGLRKGCFYGFPHTFGNWCNNLLKTAPIQNYLKLIKNGVDIVGIAADEPKRIDRALAKGQMLPLVDYGITENEAFEICRKNDLCSPAYNDGTFRLGCWFCHNKRICELRKLRKRYPELWTKLLDMDKDSPVTFKPDYALTEFEERFLVEDMQMSLFESGKKEGVIC